MVDIENIPLSENSIYVVYYSVNDCSVAEACSAFENLTAALKAAGVTNPVIGLPSDMLLKQMSKEDLLKVRDNFDNIINDLK